MIGIGQIECKKGIGKPGMTYLVSLSKKGGGTRFRRGNLR